MKNLLENNIFLSVSEACHHHQQSESSTPFFMLLWRQQHITVHERIHLSVDTIPLVIVIDLDSY